MRPMLVTLLVSNDRSRSSAVAESNMLNIEVTPLVSRASEQRPKRPHRLPPQLSNRRFAKTVACA